MSKRAQARREIDIDALKAIVERTRGVLDAEECEVLVGAVDTLALLTRELESKRVSVDRLRRLVFGAKTEKTAAVLGDGKPAAPGGAGDDDAPAPQGGEPPVQPPGPRKGHGRNGASDYFGATRIPIPHPVLKRGDKCPHCAKGRFYPLDEPATLVRITGMAPLHADLFECGRLRCNACGAVETAPVPAGIGTKKYDESAVAMIAELKYGTGFPFNRIEKLQRQLGVPLPASTQWELVHEGALALLPAFRELHRQAAQAPLIHDDDTTMRVLELTDALRAEEAADKDTDGDRTGAFTTALVARDGERHMAVFVTGPQHAGENLEDLLERRASTLAPPIQMCDALASNTAGEFKTILAGCLAHSRRKYVDVVESFPAECRTVLEILRDVYANDADTRAMSPEERLCFHRERSAPLMEKLEAWMRDAFEHKLVEPNSGLGEAIGYMQKHWQRLTLFLRVPGAPLDNNLAERTLKRVLLHRKNALFYKTLNGALVGDIYMSLIQTAELNDVPAFDYLVAMLRHPAQVKSAPADWMPWTWRATLERMHPSAGPAG